MPGNNRIPRQRVRWAAVLGAALLLAAATLTGFRAGRDLPSPQESAKPVNGSFRPTKEQWAGLKVAEVKMAGFQSILETDGNIAFADDAQTPVFSPYSGRVSRLLAKLGDVVKAGAPLMAVEASEFVQGRSDFAAARATLETATATEQRQHDLFDAGAAALKDWQQARSDRVAAEAAFAAARGRLRILGMSDADIEAIATAPSAMTEAFVTAPIAGTVTQRQVGLGQFITSAANGAGTPVYTIADLSSVWLVANVRESDAPRLRLGQEATVRVLALPGRSFKAKLTWIGAAVDPATHRLPVRAVVPNPGGELKPQMFASFAIATGAAAVAPAVPESAVMYDGDITRVFVVAADGGIAGRAVRAGRTQDGLVEIVAGLRPGEQVVTAGTLFIDRAAASE